MAKSTQTGQLLTDYLNGAAPLSPETVWSLIRQLVDQVEQLHSTGQLHRKIGSNTIWITHDDCATLQPPVAECVDFATTGSIELLPSDLEDAFKLQLPHRIDQAEEVLKKRGIPTDPRRIDLFLLGQLALKMLTRDSIANYLMRPKVKAAVPAPWRVWIDRSLGFAPNDRAERCEQLQLALADMAPEQVGSNFEATPPAGTGVDVHRDTPLHGSQLPGGLTNTDLPFTQLGQYRIDAKLGSGGMGDVYRGYDPRLDRTVAVKVLPSELARNQDFVHRFNSEARAAAQLAHPHIVPTYFIGEDHGTHFFVMQYIDGPTLADVLKSRGALEVDHALELVEQVTSGLAAAHARGLIHRDIKPGNVLLDQQTGQAKLADFGLVKSLSSNLQATATGVVMGTVDYISPEQGRGQVVDGRSDLYSVGVLLYQLFSGKLPFEADSPTAMVFQHAYEKPKPLIEAAPNIPSGAVTIVDRLLLKNPDDRYQSAEDLAADLKIVREGGQPSFESIDVKESDTRIVLAPDFEANQGSEVATATHVPMINQGWRTRLLAMFNQHAPEGLKDLQSTQQQVDGGIAVYTDRRNKLAALATEARAMEKELAEQIAEQKSAVAAAEERVQRASSTADKDAAIQQVELHHKAFDLLSAQLIEQKVQTKQIDLRLARVDTTLQKLRSQQQLLLARLETAQAGIHASSDSKAPQSWQWAYKKKPFVIITIAGVTFLLLIMLALQNRKESSGQAGILANSSTAVLSEKIVWPALPSEPGPLFTKWYGWINLLSSINPVTDCIAYNGTWAWRDGALIAKTDNVNCLALPVLFSKSYDLQCQFTIKRQQESQKLEFGFPLGIGNGKIVFDPNTNRVGMAGVNGLAAFDPKNHVRNPTVPLKPQQTHRLSMHAKVLDADAEVAVVLNEKEILRWKGRQSALQAPVKTYDLPGKFTLTVQRGEFDFHQLRVHANGDSIGRFSHLPADPSVLPTTGQKYGLKFLGDKRHVDVREFEIEGQRSYTIEAWVIPEPPPVGKRPKIVVLGQRGNVGMFRLGIDENGSWHTSVYDKHKNRGHDARYAEALVTWGKLTHVAGVYRVQNGTKELELFVDGKSVAKSESFTNVTPAGHRIKIGADHWDGPNRFRGIIKQVRISDSDRYAADFKPEHSFYNDDKTLALYYLDEGRGHVIYDSSGNGLHGMSRGPIWVNVNSSTKPAIASLTGTWQMNLLSGAQRGINLVSLPDGSVLFRAAGVFDGKYRWEGNRLVVQEPKDERFIGLVWQHDDDDLILIEEPPDHPAGPSYVGARLKFISSDTSNEARMSVEKLP